MKKTKKLLVLATLAGMTAPFGATASESTELRGTMSVGFNSMEKTTDYSIEETFAIGSIEYTLEKTDREASPSVGIAFGVKQLLNNNFFLSGDLFYNKLNGETEASETDYFGGSNYEKTNINHSYGARLGLGRTFDKIDIYGVAGVGVLSFDSEVGYRLGDDSVSNSDSYQENSFISGVGLRVNVSENASFVTEYLHYSTVEYNTELDYAVEYNDQYGSEIAYYDIKGENELQLDTFNVGISYKF